MLLRGTEAEGGNGRYDRVQVKLCKGVLFGLGGRFLQDRSPDGLGLLRAGKVRHLHPRADHEQGDQEGKEAEVSQMFFDERAHGDTVANSRTQYKRIAAFPARVRLQSVLRRYAAFTGACRRSPRCTAP